MNTGEDLQSLRKIIDLTRLISLFILCTHFYLSCYQVFLHWGLTAKVIDRILCNIAKTGLFANVLNPKLASLLFLLISLLGIQGKKDEKIQRNAMYTYLITGLVLYFISIFCFYLPVKAAFIAIAYMTLTSAGYLMVLSGGTRLTRLIKEQLRQDIFNTDNETFPQEERLLENEYSINLPAIYHLKGKIRKSYISIINPFRGCLVSGSPGSR